MGWGLSVFLVGVSLGILQVGVGVAIGRWSPWGWNKRRASAIDPRRLRRFVQGLSRCVSTVADEVGEHQSQMGQLNERLATAQADGGEGLTEVVLDTVSSIMGINGKLQDRLTEAEDKLRWQAEQIASHLAAARTDPLTGLPNRRAFDDQLYRSLAEWTTRQTPVSLVMIDADHFKAINDTHGHLVGDQVLREVAEAISRRTRKTDLAARIGGEEFAVVLSHADLAQAKEAAERIRTAVGSDPCHTEHDEIHPTISVGVAQADRGEDAASLIGRADEALYASKQNGRNCGHFHDGRSCRRIGPEAIAAGVPAETETETAAESPSAVPEALLEALEQLGAAAESTDPSSEPPDHQLKEIYNSLRDRLSEILEPGASARP